MAWEGPLPLLPDPIGDRCFEYRCDFMTRAIQVRGEREEHRVAFLQQAGGSSSVIGRLCGAKQTATANEFKYCDSQSVLVPSQIEILVGIGPCKPSPPFLLVVAEILLS